VAAPVVRIVANTHGDNPDSFYIPHTVYAQVGQIVTWMNEDTDPHDATADSGTFASPPMAYHGHFRWMALRAGRYTYFCTLHPEMHGVVIVRPRK
jgi:plastocyanin